jgi:hypothetical protein
VCNCVFVLFFVTYLSLCGRWWRARECVWERERESERDYDTIADASRGALARDALSALVHSPYNIMLSSSNRLPSAVYDILCNVRLGCSCLISIIAIIIIYSNSRADWNFLSFTQRFNPYRLTWWFLSANSSCSTVIWRDTDMTNERILRRGLEYNSCLPDSFNRRLVAPAKSSGLPGGRPVGYMLESIVPGSRYKSKRQIKGARTLSPSRRRCLPRYD